MKIFFTAPIKGGVTHQREYQAIINSLQQFGAVHAPHAEDALSLYGETGTPDSEIVERELKELTDSDIVVAEVTTPGLGTGYLIAAGVAENKKVIALYQGENTLKLSSMIKGNEHITVLTYKTAEDIDSLLKTIFQA